MNIVDIILSLILVYGAVRGFFRGFFAELASLIGFIAGIYGAVHFSHFISDFLETRVSWNVIFINLFSFAIVFILIVLVISLAGKFLTQIANFAFLGIINKLLGAILGVFKTAFITSVILMFFAATNEDVSIVEPEVLEDSVLYSPIRVIAPAILPSILKEVRDLDFFDKEESSSSE